MRNVEVSALKWLVFLTAVVGSSALGQNTIDGDWDGYMVPPGLPETRAFPFDFSIERAIDGYQGFLTWGTGGDYELDGISVDEEALGFSWNYAGTHMDCRMEFMRNGLAVGGCVDDMEQVGPMMLYRPDVDAEPEEMSVQQAHDALGVEYVPPQPRKTFTEIENEMIAHAVPEGRKVTVGGLDVNVVTRGTGDTTVVFESGIGEGLRVWRDVIGEVSEFASVVAYDRPGIGYSAEADHPFSLNEMVEHLGAVLAATGAQPPYVLVGHDTGAYIMRLFASRHPEEIVGIVLVHPAHEKQEAFWTQMDPENVARQIRSRDAFQKSMPPPFSDEYGVFSQVAKQGDFEAALPDVPLVVITGNTTQEYESWVGETTPGRAVLRGLHKQLSSESRAGEHIVVAEAGSYVQNQAPKIVIEAIRDIVVPAEEDE